mgnify:CR=1 FL=1
MSVAGLTCRLCDATQHLQNPIAQLCYLNTAKPRSHLNTWYLSSSFSKAPYISFSTMTTSDVVRADSSCELSQPATSCWGEEYIHD